MADGDADGSLLRLVNGSGFPFQIGVREEINRTSQNAVWRVLSEEHPWNDSRSNKDEYIDLIAHGNSGFVNFRLVIECKRVREDANWVFLTPLGAETPQGRVSAFWVNRVGGSSDRRGWIDLTLRPDSPEAMYCTIHGETDTSRPMLEKIADKLLPSIEAVGLQEQLLTNRGTDHYGEDRFLIPVVVTNAALHAATFNPQSISNTSGCISSLDFTSNRVPFVRFRKSLWTGHEKLEGSQWQASRSRDPLRELNRARERSILVMNAETLTSTLTSLHMDRIGEHQFALLAQRLAALR